MKILAHTAVSFCALTLVGCQKLSTTYVPKAKPATIEQNSEDPGLTGFSDILLEVELNKAKTFTIGETSSPSASPSPSPTPAKKPVISRISLKLNEPMLMTDTDHGKLEIPDPSTPSLIYTPKTGFRGEDLATVYLFDSKSRPVSVNIRVLEKNPSATFKPSLAVRGIGCIMCHVKIHGDVITDFGYKGDAPFGGETKNDYFLSFIYGNYNEPAHRNLGTTTELEGRIIVPKVQGLKEARIAPAMGYDLEADKSYSLAEMIRVWLPDHENPNGNRARFPKLRAKANDGSSSTSIPLSSRRANQARKAFSAFRSRKIDESGTMRS